MRFAAARWGRWAVAIGLILVLLSLLILERTGDDGVRFANLTETARSRRSTTETRDANTANAEAREARTADSGSTTDARRARTTQSDPRTADHGDTSRNEAEGIRKAKAASDEARTNAQRARRGRRSRACARVLEIRAKFNAKIDALIQQYPGAEEDIEDIRDTTNEALDNILDALDCERPSGI